MQKYFETQSFPFLIYLSDPTKQKKNLTSLKLNFCETSSASYNLSFPHKLSILSADTSYRHSSKIKLRLLAGLNNYEISS